MATQVERDFRVCQFQSLSYTARTLKPRGQLAAQGLQLKKEYIDPVAQVPGLPVQSFVHYLLHMY